MPNLTEFEIIGNFEAHLQNIGITSRESVVLASAVCLGAREALKVNPKNMKVRVKEDGSRSFQTSADLITGEAMRKFIRIFLPTCRINEEETGIEPGTDTVIYIDPLDGTNIHARGLPYFTTGAATYSLDGLPLSAAICSGPNKELLVAQVGVGSFRFALTEHLMINSRIKPVRLAISDRRTLDGSIGFVDAYYNAKNTNPKESFRSGVVIESNHNIQLLTGGSNIDQQRHVAAGGAEFTLTDAVGGPWDLMVGRVVIEAAGGMFTDLSGDPISEATQAAIGSNGHLHDTLLRIAQIPYQHYRGYK